MTLRRASSCPQFSCHSPLKTDKKIGDRKMKTGVLRLRVLMLRSLVREQSFHAEGVTQPSPGGARRSRAPRGLGQSRDER